MRVLSKKLLSVILAAIIMTSVVSFVPTVSARDVFLDPYAVVIEGGSAVFDNRNGAFEGEAFSGDVLTVTANEVPGREFDYWKTADGEMIPDATFRVLVNDDLYVAAHYTDTDDAPYGAWETYYESHDCEIATVLRRENALGDVDFMKMYMNGGRHDAYYPQYTGLNDDNDQWDGQRHYGYCRVCGKELIEDHEFDGGEITLEPTHTEPGMITYTCYVCGYPLTEEIPPTEEHKWGEWVVTTPATDGYGVRERSCVWCGATEESICLDPDLKALWTDHYIEYSFSTRYGNGHDERYISYTNDDGSVVYVYAMQLATTGGGADNGQTFVYMYVDDGDDATYEPVYMTKSGTTYSSMMGQFIWAPYDYVRSFDGFVEVIRHPDGVNAPGIMSGNNMSSRGATLPWRFDDWAEEVNRYGLTSTDDVAGQLGFEIEATDVSFAKKYFYEDNELVYSGGGFDGCTTYRKAQSEWGDYDYYTVDPETGITVRKWETVSNTNSRFEAYQEVVDADTYAAMNDYEKQSHFCVDDIAANLRQFSLGGLHVGLPSSLSLDVPDPYTAVRVQIDRTVYNDDFTVSGRNWDYSCYSSNVAGVHTVANSADFPNYYALTFTWDHENGNYDVFDRWEIFNFETRTWETLSYDPVMVINTYSDPLTDLTVIRPVYHTDAPLCMIEVEGGHFCYSGEDEPHNSEPVPGGGYIYLVADEVPEGMKLSHFVDISSPDQNEYYENYEFTPSGDMYLVPFYEPIAAWVSVSIPSGCGGFVGIDNYDPDDTWADIGGVDYGEELTLVAVTDTENGYTDDDFAGWYRFWWDDLYCMERTELISTDLITTVTITEESPVYYAIWNEPPDPDNPVEPLDTIKLVAENGFIAPRREGGMIESRSADRSAAEGEQNAYSSLLVPGGCVVLMYDDPSDNIELAGWNITYTPADTGEAETLSFDIFDDEIPGHWVEYPDYYLEDTVILFSGYGRAPSVQPGDVNGDGDLDAKDVRTLKRYISSAITIDEIVPANADIDGIEGIDIKDLKALKRIIAGA